MDSSNVTLMTREPAVAGKFYPGSATVLRNELQRLFKGLSPPPDVDKTLAIISPHAGYVFSGNVAASGFMHIDPDKDYNNVFVIGSSHHVVFEGASVYTRGNFRTPLGVVPVNTKLSRELIAASNCFTDRSEVHHDEHSLEVQLPFLQFRLKKPFQIVPLIIGTREPSTCKKMADILLPYFNHQNLFIISTDFSHYPDYEDACRIDKETIDAIISNEPEVLFKTIMDSEKAEIPGLSTCLCGWTSVLTLMYITRRIPGINYNLINYQNSGDSPFIRKSGVVGYCSVTIEAMHDE